MASRKKQPQSIVDPDLATKSEGRAILALLLSATLWGLIWYPLRFLENHGIDGLWSSLIIYGSLIPVGLYLVRHQLGQWRAFRGPLLLIGLASGWTNVAFIVAVIDGNVVRVLLLFYLSPIWAIAFAWGLIGERPHLPAALTALVALAGAMIMLWEPSLGFPWPREASDWLALTAGMAFAAANVSIRATPGLALNMKMAANWLGVSLVAGAWIVFIIDPVPAVPVSIWMLALALGAVMLVMTLTVQYGVSHLPVYRSSIILLFELVAGAVSSQLLTDEVIQPREFVGGGLIILAAWLSARSHHK
jgi:drug/metabolite transporter (DMT)-like permease